MTSPRTLIAVPLDGLDAAPLTDAQKIWARDNAFSGQSGRLLPLPDEHGALSAILFGTGAEEDRSPLVFGLAAANLEKGSYTLAGTFGDATLAALGFRLGAYRFSRAGKAENGPELVLPEGADGLEVERLVQAAWLARDLVNMPPNELGPDAFERTIRSFAQDRGMSVSAVVGDDLLEQNFPMIHAVGRASAQAPRLLDLSWGDPAHPKVTLVGKGVTFDTGGLDIKSPSNMALMKKDMGGAANILGLAHAIVDAKLKVRLRVLLPVVENAISGTAFRPGDVLASRKGLTVEIGNTDAEGRLILADALALADEDNPDLIVDMATLTGSARIALGPELPPLYARDQALADQILAAGVTWDDPTWQMPLWAGYEKMLKSRIADVNHIAGNSFAGSVVAALFLGRFVKPQTSWVHLDIYAWAPEMRPGRPFGGTDQGIRALYAVLKERYGQ